MTHKDALLAAVQAMEEDMIASDKLDVINTNIETISQQIELSNCLAAGIILFIGVVFGLLLVNVLWERFK